VLTWNFGLKSCILISFLYFTSLLFSTRVQQYSKWVLFDFCQGLSPALPKSIFLKLIFQAVNQYQKNNSGSLRKWLHQRRKRWLHLLLNKVNLNSWWGWNHYAKYSRLAWLSVIFEKPCKRSEVYLYPNLVHPKLTNHSDQSDIFFTENNGE
jgi:hypothetical protein